jgi:purine-binding chemotaxis protein CheW
LYTELENISIEYGFMTSSKPQRQVDWEAVWKSLNWDDKVRQQAIDQERLRQRAEHYATPVKTETEVSDDARTVLTFELGDEHYAIDVMVVRGIRVVSTISRVPGVPPFYRGIINVRGQILSVLDLRVLFQIPVDDGADTPGEVITVRSGRLDIALLARQVNGVKTIPASAIKNVDHMPYALGITPERVILLDIPQLFADERLIIGGVSE